MTWEERSSGLEEVFVALQGRASDKAELAVKRGRSLVNPRTPDRTFLESAALTYQSAQDGAVVICDLDVAEAIFKGWPRVAPNDHALPAVTTRVPLRLGQDFAVAGRAQGSADEVAETLLVYVEGLRELVRRLGERM